MSTPSISTNQILTHYNKTSITREEIYDFFRDRDIKFEDRHYDTLNNAQAWSFSGALSIALVWQLLPWLDLH